MQRVSFRLYIYIYIYIYIRHTLGPGGHYAYASRCGSRGSSARNQTWGRARASHAVRRVVTTVPVPMEEQCRRASARARKRKQSDAASEETKEKETESDRLRKKRCIQGESSGGR